MDKENLLEDSELFWTNFSLSGNLDEELDFRDLITVESDLIAEAMDENSRFPAVAEVASSQVDEPQELLAKSVVSTRSLESRLQEILENSAKQSSMQSDYIYRGSSGGFDGVLRDSVLVEPTSSSLLQRSTYSHFPAQISEQDYQLIPNPKTHHGAPRKKTAGEKRKESARMQQLRVKPNSFPSRLNFMHPTIMDRILIGPSHLVIKEKLYALAEAVATSVKAREDHLRSFLEEQASTNSSPMQRVTNYCLMALDMKMGRREVPPPPLSINERPKDVQMLIPMLVTQLPYVPCAVEATRQTVMEATEERERIHIIDFGSWPGTWNLLLRNLAARPSGCPCVRLTAVQMRGDVSHLRQNLQAMGRELEALAFQLGLPFQFCTVPLRVESLQTSAFFCSEGEAVVVNCVLFLDQLPDASVLRFSPRDKVIQLIRDLNPALVMTTGPNIDLNTNFFLPRFKTVVESFECLNAALEEAFPGGGAGVETLHEAILKEEILNTIACEGLARWCRPESFERWVTRFRKAGLSVRPLSQHTVARLQSLMQNFSPSFSLRVDSGAAQLFFKDSPSISTVAWRMMA